MTKTCRRCEQALPVERFHRQPKSDGYMAQCKDCRREYEQERRARIKAEGGDPYASQRAWNERNPGRHNELRRQAHDRQKAAKKWYLYRYGLTLEDLGRMRSEQEGCCACCGDEAQKLVVDHDHATGVVRALLCEPCNKGIGHFKDDPSRLLAAIRYLNGR